VTAITANDRQEHADPNGVARGDRPDGLRVRLVQGSPDADMALFPELFVTGYQLTGP
jgi:hypothetical protein